MKIRKEGFCFCKSPIDSTDFKTIYLLKTATSNQLYLSDLALYKHIYRFE